MRDLLTGVFVFASLAALAVWVWIVVYGLKVLSNVRPGVSRWSRHLLYNPANVVFHPELLTTEGLTSQALGWAVAIFAALVSGLLLLAALSGNLKV